MKAESGVVEAEQAVQADSATSVLIRVDWSRINLPLGAILLAQALWTGWLSASGWFYQDDLSALDEASGRRLGWAFLTLPVNDHLVPGYRFVFWLQRHTAPLSYAPTVVIRVALQTLAVYLLYRLLKLLFGERPGVLVCTAIYAFNPLIVSNLTWLTTAACLVPAELAAILAIHEHVRYTVSGRLRYAVRSGIALLIGMCFWEKTAIIGLILPVLSLGYLSAGPFRERFRSLVRRWPGWLATAAPPLAFVAYFLANHYGGSARDISFANLVVAIRTAWLRMAAPAMFGGPWRWFDGGTAYVSWSSPSTIAVVLCQIAFVGLVILGWRRIGARSLLAWSIPAISIIVGTGMVAVGRFFAFGDLISVTMRYSFDFALALTLGAALALLPTKAADIAARAGVTIESVPPDDPVPRRTRHHRRGAPIIVLACALALVASSVVSAWRFQTRWEQNPTEPYVDTLTRNIAAAGPSVNVYDTSVSSKVVPYFFGPTLHLSELLGWTDAKVRFDQTDTAPLLVDQDGNLQPASILPASYGVLPPNQTCEVLAHGVGTWRVPLTKELPFGEGFLRLEYFQQRPSTLSVQIEDSSGALVDPTGGSRVAFPVTLGAQLIRLRSSTAAAVVVKSDSAAMNICIGNIVIGAPFAPQK
jgi:hypothetical protein